MWNFLIGSLAFKLDFQVSSLFYFPVNQIFCYEQMMRLRGCKCNKSIKHQRFGETFRTIVKESSLKSIVF